MSKLTSEMTEQEITAQRERAKANYQLKKGEAKEFEIMAVEAEINKMGLSPTHRAYLKLGALFEIARD